MRMEHRQIRAILVSMQDAQQARDADAFLGHSETLNGRLEEIMEAMERIEATA